ncbi:unnamed protein product (macronuclear) [Paramecium tetraurelia]|uniref:RBR-type E3 ubiquitin transferase n=1 Tax=Paramecium tetraurelia TaxID=5888 RepID=Q6BGH1_PARTE|nr:Zn-finger protein [Paramecium tetraurelia strain d4-2]XP_001423463.1 uncharacterized protein GSPATT00000501001 [Paramecium tetraurelia]CAH03249.1 Zn-finger protein, putative [Paramecium tetraurelia]CAK56065.1 unnamed protein product [Paramecium tetraurelia]|eukprot:XP_001423463.1 hypothetical protein (macronuclear) [Paramecium tetraurelia strain d4-2]
MSQYSDYQYDIGSDEDYEIETQKNNEILLSQEELYQEFLDHLDKIKEQLELTMTQVVLNILIFFNFDVQQIYEQLLLNSQADQLKKQLQEQGIYNLTEVHIQKNMRCAICQENGTQGISLNCSHKFCKNCWNQMIEVQFVGQIPIVKCLQDQCPERLPHLYLEQFPKYKQILIKRFMHHDDAITWCPGQNCENVFKWLKLKPSIKCPCKTKFCSKCREEKHYPIPCDIVKKVLEHQQSGDYWAIINASKCPKCGRLIQKTEGCLHLKCLCGQHFCYECSKPWVKDHEKSFYVCPYANTNKNLSRYTSQLKNELQIINFNIRNLGYSIKDLQQNVKIIQIEHLAEQSEKTISLLKASRSFLYYKFYLMEDKVDEIYERTLSQFQDELNNFVEIVSKKKQEVDTYKHSQEKIIENINFNDLEKKQFSNLKIKKKFIKNYIKETLMM